MSHKSQEKNMRKLADLLGRDLSYIWGERESGPNGDKKVFLNTGKTFLQALSKDLGLQEVSVSSNPGGIAVSGESTLMGMWQTNGLYVQFSSPALTGRMCCSTAPSATARTTPADATST